MTIHNQLLTKKEGDVTIYEWPLTDLHYKKVAATTAAISWTRAIPLFIVLLLLLYYYYYSHYYYHSTITTIITTTAASITTTVTRTIKKTITYDFAS